jgi:hypothetical protein
VLHPPSVFSYFSPWFAVRGTTGEGGTPLTGPEFQILTSVTAFERANFVARVLGGTYAASMVIDYTEFTARARDAAALVDYANLLFRGGQMTTAVRAEIIAAVRTIAITNPTERLRTALYLTLATAPFQVDR